MQDNAYRLGGSKLNKLIKHKYVLVDTLLLLLKENSDNIMAMTDILFANLAITPPDDCPEGFYGIRITKIDQYDDIFIKEKSKFDTWFN
jgi:hypothetical protein